MEQENVLWEKEGKVLTLESLAVFEYEIDLPQLAYLGRGGRRMEEYYAHLGEKLRRRWQGWGYVGACVDFGRCQEAGRQFVPWRGKLKGIGGRLEEEVLIIEMEYSESHGGEAVTLPLCDRWTLPWGCPTGKIGKHEGEKK